MKAHTCPRCDGNRHLGIGGPECPTCKGTGVVWEPEGPQEAAASEPSPRDLTYTPEG